MLNLTVNETLEQGTIFLALIAMFGLVLQKKPVGDVIHGTVMMIIGLFVLSQDTEIMIGNSIDKLVSAFNTMPPQASGTANIDISIYGTRIGVVMLLAFAANLVFAKFIKQRTVFLAGHIFYWFPYVFIAAGIDARLAGGKLIGLAAISIAAYMIISPNILFSYVKAVTGDPSSAIGHPTTCLPLLVDTIVKFTGDKSHSIEGTKFPKSLNFLHEASIIGSLAVATTCIMMFFILRGNDFSLGEVWGYAGGTTGISTYIFTKTIYFGVGVTILLLDVRMLTAEIILTFKGITEKVVSGITPALDYPLLLLFVPNASVTGFIVAMITSTLTTLLTAGIFPTVIIPLTLTCSSEISYTATIPNTQSGIRGCIIGTAIAGIVIVFLVGFSSYFSGYTINNWVLVYGDQDFPLQGIVEGLTARLIT